MNLPEESFWISTEEAAEIAQFHVEYIRELLRDGKIRGRKWGRSWMVDKNSLAEYVSEEHKSGWKRGKPRKS